MGVSASGWPVAQLVAVSIDAFHNFVPVSLRVCGMQLWGGREAASGWGFARGDHHSWSSNGGSRCRCSGTCRLMQLQLHAAAGIGASPAW